jgi:hypothetical protein
LILTHLYGVESYPRPEKDGSEEMETEGAREETMERNK